MKLSEELAWRGFVNQTTYEGPSVIDKSPVTFYLGVDPSAESMTIGNLATVMMARHFINHGHKAVLLVGGATGLIGDPDGKARERELIDPKEVEKNKQAIVDQFKTVFSHEKFEVVDNYNWFKDVKYLDFLRDVGKHVPMRQMLGRDFVQSRLKEGGAGISYAEFSYVLIQAYDFLYLNRKKGVTLQICGSDQWGNSIAGVDLIRRLEGKEAHVWSAPLVVNKATGAKFGKSEEGAVWLDPKLTSPYSFYQFWLNVDDEGASDYLKIYTLITPKEHESLMKEFEADRGKRAAQKYLAYEVTKLIHGKETADSVRKVTEILFGSNDVSKLGKNEIKILSNELMTVEADDMLQRTLVKANLASSNSEASRFIGSGAVYINGQKHELNNPNWFKDGYNILRCGKNKFALVTHNNK